MDETASFIVCFLLAFIAVTLCCRNKGKDNSNQNR